MKLISGKLCGDTQPYGKWMKRGKEVETYCYRTFVSTFHKARGFALLIFRACLIQEVGVQYEGIVCTAQPDLKNCMKCDM